MATPDPDAPGHYNNSHRAFLQAFLSRSTLTFEEAKPILAQVLSAQEGRRTLTNDITTDDFNNYIHTLNAALQPFDYEIRFTYPQDAPTRTQNTAIYALVNTTSDPQTQLATSHTPDEIAFVKRVLDAMFETNNTQSREVMAVKGMDAVRLNKVPRDRDSTVSMNGNTQGQQTQGSTAAAITMDHAEKLLDSLVEEGWFVRSRGGYYSLSPRALMELRSWLAETYNDPEDDEEDQAWQRIKFCEGCKEIVTVGQRCSDRDCLCRFHDFCAGGFFRTHSARKCPACKNDWTGDKFVGERAARGANVSAGRASVGHSGSRRGQTSMQDEEPSSE